MDEEIVFGKVVGHLSEFLEQDLSHIRMDSRLVASFPGLDSLTIFEMMLYLEDCFEVKFDDFVMSNIDTVGQLVAYISGRLSEDAAPK